MNSPLPLFSQRASRGARPRSVASVALAVTLVAAACSSNSSTPGGGTGGSTTGGGTGGIAAGQGGHVGAGGSTGAGGTSGGGSGGQAGAPAGTGGAAGAGGMAGAGALGCSTDATFCSGFETAGMPAGSTYRVNAAPGDWSRDFAIDTTVHNSGGASLRVKSSSDIGTSGSAYKMLAVPATSGKFWVRFYVRSDMPLGGVDHNAFVEASASDDPNDGVILEFAEDAGLGFNSHDDDRWPPNFGRTTGGAVVPFTLSANDWHCVEISFDSQTRTQMLYMNGSQQINVTNYPVAAQVGTPFASFRFGFNQFHGPARQMWYDDVVVAPTRNTCP